MRERRMGKGASLGKEAVLADSGWAGEKSDLFSILLGWRGIRRDGSVPYRAGVPHGLRLGGRNWKSDYTRMPGVGYKNAEQRREKSCSRWKVANVSAQNMAE